MKTKTTKMMAPIECKTINDALRLKNQFFGTADYCMLLDMDAGWVTLTQQKCGESATGSFRIAKMDFDKFVRWYTRPQKTRKSTS